MAWRPRQQDERKCERDRRRREENDATPRNPRRGTRNDDGRLSPKEHPAHLHLHRPLRPLALVRVTASPQLPDFVTTAESHSSAVYGGGGLGTQALRMAQRSDRLAGNEAVL